MPIVQVTPVYHNRSPEDIVSTNIAMDSAGYVFRGLSWLDYTLKNKTPATLSYAASDIRQGIEWLLIEEIVVGVSPTTAKHALEGSLGNAKRLQNLLQRVAPHYNKLVDFTIALINPNDPISPGIIRWNTDLLVQYWTDVSKYLHWVGDSGSTLLDDKWLQTAVDRLQDIANYIWSNYQKGFTGILIIDTMPPEVRDLWIRFNSGEIGIDAVKRSAKIMWPMIVARK